MNFAPRPSDRRIPLTETAPHHSTGIAKLHRSRLLKRVNTALKDVCQVKSSRSKVEYGRGECQRPRYGFHLHIGQGGPLERSICKAAAGNLFVCRGGSRI